MKNRKELKVTAFCFWEGSRIGVNFRDDRVSYGADLTLDEAKDLLKQLSEAVENYEKLERDLGDE